MVPESRILKATVVVCTRNRARMLEAAVQSLLGQSYPSDDFEVLVIDNASQDETPAVVSRLASCVKSPAIRYYREEHLGISWARNAGWQNGRGEYIVYIDDDNSADAGWLGALIETLETRAQTASGAGGVVALDWEGSRPEWLPSSLERYYSPVYFGHEARFLSETEYPLTANLAIRREVFTQSGGFRTDLGHRGTNLIGGEDVEWVRRVRERGVRIFYVPTAKVFHRIPRARQTRRWLFRRVYHAGMSQLLLDDSRLHGARYFFYNLRSFVISALKAGLAVVMHEDQQAVLALSDVALYSGRMVQHTLISSLSARATVTNC